MRGVPYPDRRDGLLSGFWNCRIHRLPADDLTEGRLSVDDRCRYVFLNELGTTCGIEETSPDLVDIFLGNSNAVKVVPSKVSRN